MNKIRQRAIALTLAGLFATTGCGASNGENKSTEESKDIYIEIPNLFNYETPNPELDRIFGLKKLEKESTITIDGLFDTSSLTEEDYSRFKEKYGISEDRKDPYATFVHVVDEKTLVYGDNKSTEGKKVTFATIAKPSGILFPYLLVKNSVIPKNYLNIVVKVKKIRTLDYQTIYNVSSKLTFTEGIEKFIPEIKVGDSISCNTIVKSEKDGTLTEIYRLQSGVGCDSDYRIKSFNYHSSPILLDIDNTIFGQLEPGEYDEEYLNEAIDTYLGTDNYYSPENIGKDFSMFSNKKKSSK